MKEEFKDISINNTHLTVSNLGKIFKDNIELRQNENHDGYLVVYVGNNRSIGVHRLVAIAFIENPLPELKNEVNHKDFNRKNNLVENLEWLSHKENIEYSRQHGRYSSKFGEDNSNYGNTKLSNYYKENPDISIEKQSRKGSQNGKAKPIKLYKDGTFINEFNYIGDCCEYLAENHNFSSNAESVRCGIRRSISKGRPYKGFTFEK